MRQYRIKLLNNWQTKSRGGNMPVQLINKGGCYMFMTAKMKFSAILNLPGLIRFEKKWFETEIIFTQSLYLNDG
jgi:hypothetical protein